MSWWGFLSLRWECDGEFSHCRIAARAQKSAIVIVERSGRHAVASTMASLLIVNLSDVAWQDKLNSVNKEGIVGKTKAAPNWQDEDEDNNQDEDGLSDDNSECHDNKNEKISLPKCEALDTSNELQHLRNENATLTRRLEQMETKLQQTIETHTQIEQRLRSQLQTVLHEQKAAAEHARKVRTLLSRVSNWMRQVQRAAQRERSSLHKAKPLAHDLELRVTPRTESPYTLWSSGTRLATNVPECDESPTASNKFSLNQEPLQWPDSYNILVDNVNPVPPPAPGRNRAKSLPAKSFNYVGYSVPSPADGSLLKPVGGTEVVLDGLPSVAASPRRVRKRSAGSLLAYCAQVVTTSLAGVRSSPSPQSTVTPAWKLDRLASVTEGHEVDEEAGQCSRSSKPLDVALPNLSIGLL